MDKQEQGCSVAVENIPYTSNAIGSYCVYKKQLYIFTCHVDSETWDFWTDADFRNQYDNVGDSINNALLADKQEGSRFDDTLTADSNILVALPDTWSEVAISSEMFTALVYGSNPLFFEYTNNNQELKDLGVKVGDEVSFTPESEYEFYVEEEKLYRMFTDNITMIM